MVMIFEYDTIDILECTILCELFDHRVFRAFDIELDKVDLSSFEIIFDKVRKSYRIHFYTITQCSVCFLIHRRVGVAYIFTIDKKFECSFFLCKSVFMVVDICVGLGIGYKSLVDVFIGFECMDL
jgi:hypothetical protein